MHNQPYKFTFFRILCNLKSIQEKRLLACVLLHELYRKWSMEIVRLSRRVLGTAGGYRGNNSSLP
jgi:hypothetical protein